jgi:hypothetical protein
LAERFVLGGGCVECSKVQKRSPKRLAASRKSSAHWYKKNKVEIKKRLSGRREKIKTQQAAWYAANRNKVLAKVKAWGTANRDKINAQLVARRAANPEKKRMQDAAYRARKRAERLSQTVMHGD